MKERKHSDCSRSLSAILYHLTDWVLDWEMDEKINNAYTGWLRPWGTRGREAQRILPQDFQSLEGRRVLVRPSVMAREGRMQVGVGQPWPEWWEEEGRRSSCGRCLPLTIRQSSVPDWPSQSLTFQDESVSLSISGCLFTGPEGRIWLEHRRPLNSWIWPKFTQNVLFFAAVLDRIS